MGPEDIDTNGGAGAATQKPAGILTKKPKPAAQEGTPVTGSKKSATKKKAAAAAKPKAAKPVKAAKGGAASSNGARRTLAEQRSRRKELFPLDVKVTYKGRREAAFGKTGTVVGHQKGDDAAGVFVKIGDERFVCSPYSLEAK
jgi:hypothetical protein